MATHIINYDLLRPGQNYDSLIAALRNMGAKRILLSTWLMQSTSEPKVICDALRPHIDANDRMFVASMGTWAWTPNMMADPRQI
jgi:hypothetical protein